MEFLRNHKKILIIGLTMFAFVAMAYSSRERYAPGPIERGFGFVVTNVQGFFANIGSWVEDRIGFLANMNELHAENQRLNEDILILQTERARDLHLQERYNEMILLLGIRDRYSQYPTLGANIIAEDPSNWNGTFLIDQGASNGVAVDMVVLAPGGLAGRVSKVGTNFARVTPIIEDMSRVSAQSLRTGDWGIVRGDTNLSSHGLLRMEFIARDADIAVGDEIVTSSNASIYPPGIHIGYVVEMARQPDGMRTAFIRPSVNFNRLTMILVITELFEHELID